MLYFHDNAHAKRKFPGNRKNANVGSSKNKSDPAHSSMSFSDMMARRDGDV